MEVRWFARGSDFNPNQPFALGITCLSLNRPWASGLLLIIINFGLSRVDFILGDLGLRLRLGIDRILELVLLLKDINIWSLLRLNNSRIKPIYISFTIKGCVRLSVSHVLSCPFIISDLNTRAAKDIRHIDQLSDIARSFSVWKLILLSTGLNYWLYIDAHRIMESWWITQTNITNNSPFMFWIAKYCCLLLIYTLNNCTNQLKYSTNS